ncbi:hypothetical protein LKO27_04365 [Tessaracoccus sp. OS52]|uniref:hypothetical protein n=1 Tax=Tessaracoccus sp. OS52 TaxID=2886691 RepID=UPI001D1083A5|nr:hypothetical protein [Tessaracoccus sp. OS52]MCC2592650.1 hypothetical protein [Tessaracoccus sp. OS52]
MLVAWAITLPAAGLVGALVWFIGHNIGSLFGALVVFGILVASSLWMYHRSQQSRVDHRNVNDEWVEKVAGAQEDPVLAVKGKKRAKKKRRKLRVGS